MSGVQQLDELLAIKEKEKEIVKHLATWWGYERPEHITVCWCINEREWELREHSNEILSFDGDQTYSMYFVKEKSMIMGRYAILIGQTEEDEDKGTLDRTVVIRLAEFQRKVA
ncbi:hypothetical protein GR7B_00027 [Vibrio phage vB_VcorM_GR7B]|nr:hypothetical protein GR7B_00027 [Vibrio phage vB_VcorM_GR7B]